jgi:hypothetical protein
LDAQGAEVFDSGWRSNLIVARCRILLGSFMNNEGTAKGIQTLRVGRGDPLWDTTPPPLPDPNLVTQLVDTNPFIIPRGPSLVIQYLNDSDAIVANPTSRVQVVATLGPNQPTAGTYQLREFGLFGELQGQPFMIDYIRHPLIEKSGSVTLERRVRLIF